MCMMPCPSKGDLCVCIMPCPSSDELHVCITGVLGRELCDARDPVWVDTIQRSGIGTALPLQAVSPVFNEHLMTYTATSEVQSTSLHCGFTCG